MIFLLVISYSILGVVFLGFIIFAVKVKNTMIDIDSKLTEMKQEVTSTRDLFRHQIGELLSGVKDVINRK